tara:strand:+ start:113 stop:292 length:180 start_codon:yes stop_codon:yes gene_type:complete
MGKTIKKIVAIGGGEGVTHELDDTLDQFYKAKNIRKTNPTSIIVRCKTEFFKKIFRETI